MRKLIRPTREEMEKLKKAFGTEHTSEVARRRTPVNTTGKLTTYLQDCIGTQKPMTIKLRDGRELQGWIEYYDVNFIRLTMDGAPNQFIFKKDILYMQESQEKRPRKRSRHG